MSGALSSAACETGNSTVSAGSGAASPWARASDVRTLATAVTGQILEP
jgi:hypothetical protein